MKIKKTKPYFIKLAYTEKEFIQIQKELFKKGYRWFDNSDVWISNENFVKYPIYISNLPLLGCDFKFDVIREIYNFYNNNILFLDNNKESFDLKLLRSEKLKKISSL